MPAPCFFFTCFYLILSTYLKSPKIFADQVPRIGQSGALSAYVEPGPLSAYVEDGTLSAYVEGALGSYVEVAHLVPMRDLASTALIDHVGRKKIEFPRVTSHPDGKDRGKNGLLAGL